MMTVALRHRCRNPKCRTKLPAPVESEHHAFCCRGCFESFYRNRCRVCEKDLRLTGKEPGKRRMYCRAPNTCAAEAQKWPHIYALPAADGPSPQISAQMLRSAHSTGPEIGIAGPARCLRDWRWGGDENFDWSLYDEAGLTIARLVLGPDGRYQLRSPITTPPQSWADLEEAKRSAEGFALMAMAVDPKLAARIAKDNSAPHPMGPPRKSAWPTAETSADLKIREAGLDTDPESIPGFLRRTARLPTPCTS
jgi:hypothetical protein